MPKLSLRLHTLFLQQKAKAIPRHANLLPRQRHAPACSSLGVLQPARLPGHSRPRRLAPQAHQLSSRAVPPAGSTARASNPFSATPDTTCLATAPEAVVVSHYQHPQACMQVGKLRFPEPMNGRLEVHAAPAADDLVSVLDYRDDGRTVAMTRPTPCRRSAATACAGRRAGRAGDRGNSSRMATRKVVPGVPGASRTGSRAGLPRAAASADRRS